VLDINTGKVLATTTKSLLGNIYNPVPAYPAPLYISLDSQQASTTFRNLTVSSVPEPSMLGAMLLAASLLAGRSLRHRRRS
jgi:hypothetical protein